MDMRAIQATLSAIVLLWQTFYFGRVYTQGACGGGSCEYCYELATEVVWEQITFSTTITAATIIEVINSDAGTTSYITVTNDLPSGYTLTTDFNQAGTRTVQVTYTSDQNIYTTDIAFPTQINLYPIDYFWSGTLLTTDEAGQSTCVTADSFVTVAFNEWSNIISTQIPASTDDADPQGVSYVAYIQHGLYLPDDTTPTEGALQSCQSCPTSGYSPAVEGYTARFFTTTSTSYETNSATATTSMSSTVTEPGPGTTTGSISGMVSNASSGTVLQSSVVTITETTPVYVATTASQSTPAASANKAGHDFTAPSVLGTAAILLGWLCCVLCL